MMIKAHLKKQELSVLIVAQRGRLACEAVLFAASLATGTQSRPLRLVVAEPQPGPLWAKDPRLDPEPRSLLQDLGADIRPFDSLHFGESYPQGNKIEALRVLEKGQPFVFFDTDTLVLGDLGQVPFDFERPTASLRREGTWPKPDLYGPGYEAIWGSLYRRFGLELETSLDPGQPEGYWQRYLYFNAGFFFFRCAQVFGQMYQDMALSIRDDPPAELTGQALYPWLDQIALPLVIHALGGGRDTLPQGLLDGAVSCHYRTLPLLYAREEDAVVNTLEALAARPDLRSVLEGYPPMAQVLYGGLGARARALFDRADPLPREQAYRTQLKRAGLWLR